MDKRIRYCMTGLCALFVFSAGLAQPTGTRVERWNDMWMTQNNYSFFGNDSPPYGDIDPCPPHAWAPQCEMPGGSGQQYLFWATLWVGAIIDSGGYQTPRVSVGVDGWLNPSVEELWPGSLDEVIERSTRDTLNCFGQQTYSPLAIADHEFQMTFEDTLTSSTYVRNDPIDGPHRPLGIKITRTTYVMAQMPCDHIYWIKYHVENIGHYFLKDLYLAMYVDGDVGLQTETYHFTDDLAGFETADQMAYICDNDGRPVGVSSGPLMTPNVTGMVLLSPLLPYQKLSFNWWVSNTSVALDYGPAWSAYASRDSNGMGWTMWYGTPMGDERKYQLMSNGEVDFDQVHVADAAWILGHPQDGHEWALPNDPQARDVANGFDARYLLSAGPYGNWNGDHREFPPGATIDVWFAYVGGMNFHSAAHPQPTDTIIDPSLFDFTDLIAHVQTARAGMCLNWADVSEHLPHIAPAAFALDPVYPNPFNAQARLRFALQRAVCVDIVAFDVLGREAARIASGSFAAGSHDVIWDARELTSGLYFVQARTNHGQQAVQKVVLLK